MDYIVTDVNLNERFQKLKLDVPQQLTFLPENVDNAETVSDFIFPDTLTELKKTLRLQQINIPLLGDTKAQLHGRKSADLYLPTLFVGGAALLANPHLISVALNVVSNYVYDFFKGNPGKKIVAFEIFIEKEGDKTTKKITFKGPPEGVKDLANVIKQLDK
jgi:hypothetical protein